MSGEVLQRRAAQLQLGVLHLRLHLRERGELLLFPRLLLPISTSEPVLTLQGAASCVSSQSSQCRDIHITDSEGSDF